MVHEFHILKLLQLRKEVPRNRLQIKRSHVQVEYEMTSFRYYDNSDVIITLIIGNIHLYLIQL